MTKPLLDRLYEATTPVEQTVQEASDAYTKTLGMITEANKANLDAVHGVYRDRSVSPDAMVSDSELKTFGGQVENLARTLGAESFSQIGKIAQMIPKALREHELSSVGITDEDLVNYQSLKGKQVREANGVPQEYTEAEKALLAPNVNKTYGKGVYMNQGNQPSKAESLDAFFKGERDAKSWRDKFYDAGLKEVNRKASSDVLEDAKTAYTTNVKGIQEGFEELRQGNLLGIGKMLASTSDMTAEALYAALTNPSGAVQLLAESTPAMVTASASGLMGAGSLAMANMNEAEQKFKEEYKRMPTGSERTTALGLSVASGIVGTYADRLLAGDAISAFKGALTKVGTKAATEGAETVARETIEGTTKSLFDTAAKVAGSSLREAVTESAEQALIEYGGKQDIEKMDGAEIFAAGVAGFASSGMLIGSASAIGKMNDFAKGVKASNAGKEAAKSVLGADAKADATTAEHSVVGEAARTGADLSSAVGIAKVLRNAQTLMARDDTDPSTREDSVLFAKHALSSIDNRLADVDEKLIELDAMASQEGVSEDVIKLINATKSEVLQEQKRLTKVKQDNEAAIITEYDALVSNPEVYEAAKSRLSAEKLDELADLDISSLDKDAALLTASSLVTENITPEDLETAAESPNISPQRATQLKETAKLNRLISAAKSTQEVAKDIIEGGKGFVGIKQYQSRITEHLNTGSLRTATRDLIALGKFAGHHKAKLQAYQTALEQAKQAPVGTRVPVDGFSTLPTKANPKGTPVTLDANADKLVAAIAKESELINQAFESLAKQVDAFIKPSNQSTDSKTTEAGTETAPTADNAPKAESAPTEEKGKETPAKPARDKTKPTSKKGKTDAKETTQVEQKQTLEVENNQTPTEEQPVEVSRDQVEPTTRTDEELAARNPLEDRVDETVDEQVIEEVETDSSANPALEGINQGSNAGLTTKQLENEADAKYLMTNPVSLFRRAKRGKLWGINYNNAEEVAAAVERELTPSESTIIAKLAVFLGGFNPMFTNLLPNAKTVLAKRGWQAVSAPLHGFSQENGTFSDAFIETMGISAFEYLESNGASFLGDNTTSMATLLNLDTKDFTPTRAQAQALKDVGSPYMDVAETLGRIALKNLGMKKDTEMPQNIMNGMEFDLGRSLIGTLVNAGIMKIQSYAIKDLIELGGDYTLDPNQKGMSINTVSFDAKRLDTLLGVESAIKLFGNTNGFVSELTSNKAEAPKAEIGVKTLKVSNVIRRSKGQKAPKEFVEGLQKDANEAHHIDLNMHTLFTQLGTDWFSYMLGRRSTDGRILGKHPSIEGKNKTIEVDIARYELFVNRMMETAGDLSAPFFYNYRIGKQLRASAIGSDINFQTSKFHRYMTAIEPSEIDMTDKGSMSFTLFKLAVVQGLGYGVDKKRLEDSMVEFEKVLVDPVYVAGVDAIQAILTGTEVTDAHRQAILDATAQGEEATHSLKSLVSLAEMRLAEDGKFKTSITLELDGVTNGPANAHVQMGLASSGNKLTASSIARLAQGGFFLDGTRSYTDWINKIGNMDMYQSTAVAAYVAEQKWAEDKDNAPLLEVMQSIKKYTGELVKESVDGLIEATSEGRNLLKNPVTTTVYASGARSRSDKLADALMEKMLDAIEKAVLAKDVETLNQIKQDIDTITGGKNRYPYNMLAFEFNKYTKTQFRRTFGKTMGAVVNEAIAGEFETQLANTNLVTEASNVIFELFNAMYQAEIQKTLTDLRQKGELSSRAYLSEKQLNDIKNSLLHTMPVFNTFYGNLSNGVMTAKYKGTKASSDPSFHLGKALGHSGNNFAYTDSYEAPAAGTMAILNIAFGDATTMARAAYKSEHSLGLNVFDARLSRIATASNTASVLNESAYEAVTYHNLLGTVNKRLQEAIKEANDRGAINEYNDTLLPLISRALAATSGGELMYFNGSLQARNAEGKLTKIPKEKIQEWFNAENVQNYLSDLMTSSELAHKESQRTKQILHTKVDVNQFSSVTGGARFVKGKKRKQRKLTLEETTKAVENAEKAIINAVKEMPIKGDLDQQLAEYEATLAPAPKSDVIYGEQTVIDLLNGRLEMEFDEVINGIPELLGNTVFAKVMREFLSNPAIEGVKVKVLTEDTQTTLMTTQGQLDTRNLRGYWNAAEKTIYLQGSHSPNSGLVVETLMHEALHGVLYSTIEGIKQQIRTGKSLGYSQAQIGAYKRLDKMRAKAKKEGLLINFATTDVHEFISWGLTNKDSRKALNAKETPVIGLIKKVLDNVKVLLGIKSAESTMLLDLLANALIISKAGVKEEFSLDGVVPSAPQQVHDAVRYMDLNQVYDHIAKSNTQSISTAHDTHLREVLNKAVITAINPTLLVIPDNAKTLSTQDAALLHALDPAIRKDFGLLTALNFRVSDQELMVYATYSTIIDSALKDFGWNTKEIKRMYAHAKKHLSWESFIGQDSVLDTESDRMRSRIEAQARYNAVFNNTQTTDYLRNFLALAATNEAFRDQLATLPTPPAVSRNIKGDTVRETLQNILEAILNFFNDMAITRSHEPDVLSKLDKLAKNIRHKEIKEKNKLQSKALAGARFVSNLMNTVNELSKSRIDLTFDKLRKRVTQRRLLNAAVTLSGVVLSERKANEFALGLDSIQNYMTKGRENFVASLWTDLKGTDDSNIRIHQLLAMKNKLIDQETVAIKGNTAALIREGFGRELTEAESVSATRILLKTDLASLLNNGYTAAQIGNFLANPKAVTNEITKLRIAIKQQSPTHVQDYYLNQASNTAHFMVTGYPKYKGHLMANADNIVTLFGTGEVNPNVTTSVRNAVDSLISLEALTLTDAADTRLMANLFAEESRRANENGITTLLAMHNAQKKKSLQDNFKGNEFNFVKGYIADITDPYMSIQIAPASAASELEIQNYERVGEAIIKDAADPVSEPMYMYVSNYGGEVTYLQGAASIANKAARGFSILDGYNQAGNPLPVYKKEEELAKIHKAKRIYNQKLFMPNPSRADNELIPTFDAKGRVVDYRYIMANETKDTLLRRDNRVDQVFGAMASSISVKRNTGVVNSNLMKALFSQYSHDRKSNNLSRYLLVEPNSKDKSIAQIWHMLPMEAQQEATALFGREGIYVRSDIINAAFGYRKWSIANLWNPDSEYPEIVKNAVNQLITSVHGKRIAKYFMMGERGLQELVKEAKDIVVIKSVVVLVGNFVSNTVQLPMLHGVNPIKAITDQITAINAAKEYNINAKEIFRIQAKMDAGLATPAMQLKMKQLLQDQERNPVKPLMDAGMLQTIVDDASSQEDLYSYKSGLIGKLDAATSVVPEGVKEGLKQITFQQGSIAYDTLRELTQFSDFAARYALYTHQMKNEGVSHDKAIQNITDAFVNYDLPPHKAMQYMNDMGLTWFFKYFIRMQKVIVKSFRNNPARVLGLSVGMDMLGLSVPTPIEAFAPFVDINRKMGLFDGLSMTANSLPIAQLI
ncbi:MAG: hypothetical protein ACRCVV_22070 [Shewanella sp.]